MMQRKIQLPSGEIVSVDPRSPNPEPDVFTIRLLNAIAAVIKTETQDIHIQMLVVNKTTNRGHSVAVATHDRAPDLDALVSQTMTWLQRLGDHNPDGI